MDFSSITSISDMLLTALTLYGAPILAVTILAGTAGLPLPSTTLLIAAGALARVDGMNPILLVVVAMIAAVVGDGAGFLAGKHLGGTLPARLVNHPQWNAAAQRFTQQGWGAIYLSRWLLTPISVPLNLVAGASGYRGLSFISAEVAGDLTWVLLYGGAGYLLGTQWEAASAFADTYGTTIVLWAAVGLALWFVAKRIIHRRTPTLTY